MYRITLTSFLMALLFTQSAMAQAQTDSLLANLLRSNTHPIMQQVVNQPQTYRLQVIYTQINRNAKNEPTFTNYYFNHNPQLYFNPASMVKLPLAILSLEKLNTLQ